MPQEKTYYYFNSDETLGYVGENKMKRMIAGWGYKASDFVEKSEIMKLFKLVCQKRKQ